MTFKIHRWLALLFALVYLQAHAQILKPVKWSYSCKKVSDNTYDLLLTAHIEKGWHLYSQHIGDNGPIPTSFSFNKNQDYILVGSVSEITKPIKVHDKMFAMDLLYFEDSALFVQRIKLVNPLKQVSGNLEFMACDKSKCYPPLKLDFIFDVPK